MAFAISLVCITQPGDGFRFAFGAMPKVRMVDSFEVDASSTGNRLIEVDRFRDLLGALKKVAPSLHISLATAQYLGDVFQVDFPDVCEPSPDV